MLFSTRKSKLPEPGRALPGRPDAITTPGNHLVLGNPMAPPFPDHLESIVVGMGCFWGAERVFWSMPGVWTTAVGYAGGETPNPTYDEVCSAGTGHTRPCSWSSTRPRRAPRPSSRRSGRTTTRPRACARATTRAPSTARRSTPPATARPELAAASRDAFQAELDRAGLGTITTEIAPAGEFFYAEDYHQQYLAKNPNGYCGLGGTGVSCPIGVARAAG
jgi:peptide-methionine (S)-S-oxide reductase